MAARTAVLALVMSLAMGVGLVNAQPGPTTPPDQDYPRIDLVTMGIGSLIWERHGHLALCVSYADRKQDRCYNYGVGDFRDPVGMGWGFFRGAHSFWVDKEVPGRMLAIYRNADRSIWRQPLPLSATEKAAIIAKLEDDILDDHKYYAYDHFEDNCTTRIRDVIDNATNHKLRDMPENGDGRTFRDYARDGFFGMSGSRMALLITDFAMGRSTDRVPTNYERMFLPQYLREAVTKVYGVEPIPIYVRQGPPPTDSGPSGRVMFALLILLATSPVWLTRLWGRFQRVGIAFAILPPVLLGLVFWTLAIISPLPYVRGNETCLIFFPFDLLLLVLPAAKRRLYARGRVAMLAVVALLLLVDLLHQPIWAGMLWPLIPAAVVGFWPAKRGATATAAAAAPAASTADDAAADGSPKRKKFGKRAS